MGADNWADCPKCRSVAEKAKQAERDALPKLYGKVPVEKYMKAAASAAEPAEWERSTFREDYEQGITASGDYYVSYSGQCRNCKLAHKFKHEAPVYREGAGE